MSQTSNKTLIGLFVLGAAALLVIALAVFSSGMFFTKQFECVLYFDSSVSGLEVGSPVLFRGVPVGSVKEISIRTDPNSLKFSIPVLVELTGGKVSVGSMGKLKEGETLLGVKKMDPEELIKALIEKGLRAQLVTQSFVTGQLAISLDLLPDKPLRLRGDGSTPEIPTIPSQFEEVTQTLKSLPLKELVSRLSNAVAGIDALVNSPQAAQIPARLDSTLEAATNLLNDTRGKISTLSKNLDVAVQRYSDLAGNLDQRSDKLSASARKSLEALDQSLAEGRQALGKFQKVVNPDSPSVVQLNKALAEIAQAAKSIHALADYLERHPEALIQGKGAPGRR